MRMMRGNLRGGAGPRAPREGNAAARPVKPEPLPLRVRCPQRRWIRGEGARARAEAEMGGVGRFVSRPQVAR